MEETLAAITRAQEAQAARARRRRGRARPPRPTSASVRDPAWRALAARPASSSPMRGAPPTTCWPGPSARSADVRRELTRQRNLGGSRAKAGGEAFDDLQRRAARVRSETAESTPAPRSRRCRRRTSRGPQPRVGLWGRSRTLGSAGRIVEISGRTGRVTLETEGARLVVPSDDVEVVAEPISGPSARDLEAEELRRRAAASVSPTLSTCAASGWRPRSSSSHAYLDQALLAGLDSVAIIHGSGTGALRRAVREALAEHPRVRERADGRRDEGGDGTTVAEL